MDAGRFQLHALRGLCAGDAPHCTGYADSNKSTCRWLSCCSRTMQMCKQQSSRWLWFNRWYLRSWFLLSIWLVVTQVLILLLSGWVQGRTPIDFMELQLDDESSPIGLDCSAEDITPSSRDRSQSQIRGMVRGMLYQYRPSTPRANAARERSPSTFKPSPTENQPIRCQGICTVS